MAEKEERILIARSTDYTITDTDEGALFDCNIAPHCANVFTRQEAIERMEKAMKQYAKDEEIYTDKDLAICALNALLEGK